MSKESRAIRLFLDVSQFNNYNTIMKQNKTLFELQAEVCKTLASPKRLEIINTLKTGERTVTELVNILGVSKANVSQHLALMRHKGILSSRREGVNIFYRVANPKVIEACTLMRDVLTEQMKEKSKLIDMASKG